MPPTVSPITATFVRPVTTYTVSASDPDGDTLHYTWKKVQDPACGAFTGGDSPTATWSHPDKDFIPPGDCPTEPVHAAVISVEVTDGHWTCTATDTHGSAATEGDDATCPKPVASVSPPELEFSTHVLGRVSDSQTVTVTNTGEKGSNLAITKTELYMSSGAGAMLISSDNCQGADLGKGNSCTTNVRFSAPHYGDYSGRLIYVDNADPVTQHANVSGVAKKFGGGGSSGDHTFSDAQKIALKGVDKSLNTTGNALGLTLLVSAAFPEPFITKGVAVVLAIVAGALKLGGSVCGYLAETVDPPDSHFAQVAAAAPRPVPHVKPGPGVSPAVAGAANALATNTVNLEANLHAYSTALNRATGATRAGNTAAAATQRHAAGHFASSAAAELRADAGLRAALVAKLGTAATVNVPQSALAKGTQLLKTKGVPASIAAILKAFGVSRASIAALAGQKLPSRVSVALPNASQVAHTEQATAGALQTAARKLLNS